jgi:hypothetical protein
VVGEGLFWIHDPSYTSADIGAIGYADRVEVLSKPNRRTVCQPHHTGFIANIIHYPSNSALKPGKKGFLARLERVIRTLSD